jgi:ABC-2 type transport system permease protein
MFIHAYFTKLKSRTFLVTTIIVCLGILVMSNFSSIIERFNPHGDEKNIAVVDQSGKYFEALKQQSHELDKHLTLKKVVSENDQLRKDVSSGKFDGYLLLSTTNDGLPKGIYKAETIADSDVATKLIASLQTIKSAASAESLKLNPEQLASLTSPVIFEKVALKANAKSEEELNQARGLVYVLLFFIYFSVILYSSMIATEVATEKSSRVMEILISSVSPVQQMFSKILGIALVGITQMSIYFIVGYFSIKNNLDQMSGGFFDFFGFGSTAPATLIYAIVFFLLGYLLFATLAALLGSLVSRTEDVQQIIMPMTLLIVIGFSISMFGLGKPDSVVITITSFIPFFTPMVMFLRIGMLDIPIWQALISIIEMIITIILLGIFGGRVYRGGVLMYGKSHSLKDIKKAFLLTKIDK